MTYAYRIHHEEGRIPPPSEALIEDMAISGYIRLKEHCLVTFPSMTRISNWNEASEDLKDAWRATARTMYTQLALYGGATARPLNEPEDHA